MPTNIASQTRFFSEVNNGNCKQGSPPFTFKSVLEKIDYYSLDQAGKVPLCLDLHRSCGFAYHVAVGVSALATAIFAKIGAMMITNTEKKGKWEQACHDSVEGCRYSFSKLGRKASRAHPFYNLSTIGLI